MTFIDKVKALQLPEGEYIVCGSAILEILGIRAARDIDLLVTPELYENLKKERGWEQHPIHAAIESPDHSVGAKISLDFMTQNYKLAELLPRASVHDGIPFMSLEDLRDAKVQMNREKDGKDIELIDQYLESR